MNRCLLALDFGGTKHTAGVIHWPPGGKPQDWLGHRRVFSPPGADAHYDIQAVIDLARELLNGVTPAATGVSFGGPVDARTGTVRLSHHVPGWVNKPLAHILEDALGAPASVDNDANVGALGEYHFGAGQGCEGLFYITVSTGVGGGWVLNGTPWRGADSMAGEIGHMTIDPAGPVCVCGKRGCVERLASGPYMAQDIRQWLEDRPEQGQVLRELAGGSLSSINGKMISEAAALGDELAWLMLERSASALGTGIGNTANLMNPGRFVLGGGVAKSGERFWQTIRQVARRTALPEVHFDVVQAALGDDAPLWGAAALAAALLKPHSPQPQ